MKKKKVSLFEKVEITDKSYAQKLYEKEKIKMKIKTVCTVIAAVGSICGVVAITGKVNSSPSLIVNLVSFIWLAGIAAALISGSVINTLKFILKFGQIGFYIVPFALIDLLGFVLGLAFGLIAMLILPVVPSLMTLYQSYINMKDAKDFLALDIVMNKKDYDLTTDDTTKTE